MKMLPFTLSSYIMRTFIANLFVVLSTFSVLIIIIDALELFRRSADYEVPFVAVLEMAILKFPLMGQKILPFVMLITAVLTYTRLTRQQELAVARASGVSVWQFLMPSAIIAFLFGIFITTTFNPLACAMAMKYEIQEARYLRGKDSLLEVSANGLWLRQRRSSAVYTEVPEETIIHAENASQSPDEIIMYRMIIFVYGDNYEFSKRIDADSGKLLNGFWHLKNATLTTAEGLTYQHDEYFLETDFTMADIQNSFASPETISFWQMPSFIETLRKSGFTALKHRMHWHNVLVSPLFYAAMIFIGALFSLTPARFGKTGLLITASILTGFLIYFATNVVSSLGASGTVPVIIAAWVPIILSLLVGIGVLLQTEDG